VYWVEFGDEGSVVDAQIPRLPPYGLALDDKYLYWSDASAVRRSPLLGARDPIFVRSWGHAARRKLPISRNRGRLGAAPKQILHAVERSRRQRLGALGLGDPAN
jgi:hypothetical protein